MKAGKLLLAAAGMVLSLFSAGAQDVTPESKNPRYAQFLTLIGQRDTLAVKALLEGWDREDPEYYTSAFNYWLLTGRQSGIGITAGAPEKENEDVFVLYPAGENGEEPAGYMHEEVLYDEARIAKADEVLREGIARFPDRLDMRFGLAKMWADKGEYDKALVLFDEVFRRGEENGCAWLWTLNEPVDGKSFMLDTFQDYMIEWMEKAPVADQMALADLFLRHEPDNPVFISDKAGLFYSNWEIDEALALYEKAFSLQPDDMMIAANLTILNYGTNRFEKALYYADLILQAEDGEYTEWAARIKKGILKEQATEYRTVDIPSLQKYAKKHKKEYKSLLQRFIDCDDTLTKEEIFKLYYTAPFLEYGTDDIKMWAFDKEYSDGEAEKAFELGSQLLVDSCPFSLRLLSRMYVVAEYLGRDTGPYVFRFKRLVDAILSTGNGFSIDCPIAVTAISDEYEILTLVMDMDRFAEQATLHVGGHDLDEMKYVANGNSHRICYFNVDILFYFYDRLFSMR